MLCSRIDVASQITERGKYLPVSSRCRKELAGQWFANRGAHLHRSGRYSGRGTRAGNCSPGTVDRVRDYFLVLSGGPSDPDLEAGAVKVFQTGGEFGPGELATMRQGGLPVKVTGENAEVVAATLLHMGLPVQIVENAPKSMEVSEDILELIGDTPLVRLGRLFPGRVVLGKLESLNPGGSTKDRVAVSLVDDAEATGRLLPGGHIVEPTSGNTGVGLAIVAARRGYRCTFTVPDKVAPEKIALLRAYGARVEVCPTNVPADDPRSYYSVAERIAAEDPASFRPDQYSNPANPRAHVESTGPEIWKQTGGQVTHLVAGAGTGGTLGGIGRFLKSRNPHVEVVAADPVGSVYSGGAGDPYLVEGIGEDFWPANWDPNVVDGVETVTDAECFDWARRAAREEGLLLGGSCGAALAATHRVAQRSPEGSVIVVVLPDGGRGYLSKFYDDNWMLRHGFLDEGADPGAARVRDAIAALRRPALLHVHPDENISTAALIMAEHRIGVLAILSSETVRVPGQIPGSVSASHLGSRLGRGFERIADGEPPLPLVGDGELLTAALERANERGAVIALREGQPVALLTTEDLLTAIAASR